jgi:hypothetical protein
MNIFVTNADPALSAAYLDDKRVIKMILESCQMLNTVIISMVGKSKSTGYKPTHKNHPCTVWAGTSRENYIWLIRHMSSLCNEYKLRYKKEHACQQYLEHFDRMSKFLPFVVVEQTPFVNCATDFKDEQDVYKAYKLQLDKKWSEDKRQPTWYGKPAMRKPLSPFEYEKLKEELS